MNRSLTQGSITAAAVIAAGSAAYAAKGDGTAVVFITFMMAVLFGMLAAGAQIKDLS